MEKEIIKRAIEEELVSQIKTNPIVSIVGSFNSGKYGLILRLVNHFENLFFIDFRQKYDLQIISDAKYFFETNHQKFFCLYEAYLHPEILEIVKDIIKNNPTNGRFLLLSSQLSNEYKLFLESITKYTTTINLSTLLLNELKIDTLKDLKEYWFKGGFPASFFAKSDLSSVKYLTNFRHLIIEDVKLRSKSKFDDFLKLCAISNGEIFSISSNKGLTNISDFLQIKYLEILEKKLLIRLLPNYYNKSNQNKKPPRFYFRDSGLLNNILGINSFSELEEHIIYKTSWECIVIENIICNMQVWEAYYYESSKNKISLILSKGPFKLAINIALNIQTKEINAYMNAIKELNPTASYLVIPDCNKLYFYNDKIKVSNLADLIKDIKLY